MSYFYVGIILLALGGFSISAYIHKKKFMNETLVCPIGTTCDVVIHSKYSRFFGVPITLFGMFYYGLLVVSYGLFVARPELLTSAVTFIFLGLTLTAFLFSLYLTFIQAFALKQWCTWCLISASLSTLILSLVLVGSEYNFIVLLSAHGALFTGTYLFSVALGLGGATIADVMFLKFLKDLRISEFEAEVLHTMSQVIWFALAVLVLSSLGLYLPVFGTLSFSTILLVKYIVIAVIILNGAFLNLLVTPNLVNISFSRQHPHRPGELHHIRKLAFAMGAVSLVSWYSVFVLGLLSLAISFSTLLLVYVGLLVFAIIASQLIERFVSKRTVI